MVYINPEYLLYAHTRPLQGQVGLAYSVVSKITGKALWNKTRTIPMKGAEWEKLVEELNLSRFNLADGTILYLNPKTCSIIEETDKELIAVVGGNSIRQWSKFYMLENNVIKKKDTKKITNTVTL